MGEPETLDTNEPLDERIARHGFDRLIMLSDGVFAIAITLLALEIKPPTVWSGQVLDLFRLTWRSLLGFGVSFFVVGNFWLSHKWLFARLRKVDTPLTILTLVLLVFVVLVPFMAELMALNGPLKTMLAYSLFIAVASAVQAIVFFYAAFVGGLLSPEITARQRRSHAVSLGLTPILFCFLSIFIRPGMSSWAFVPVIAVMLAIRAARSRLLRPAKPGGAPA